MGKRKNNKFSRTRSTKRVEKPFRDITFINRMHGIWSRFKGLILWLGSAGFLVLFATTAYKYLDGDVRLEFSKALSSGYEFILHNNGPADQVVEEFRVLVPTKKQDVIYKLTEGIYASVDENGIELPGGPVYMPAAEFKEIDGQVIKGNSKIQFRLPPLADRLWLQPVAVLLNIEYTTISRNQILQKIEKLARNIGFKEKKVTVGFLVLNNYWTPVRVGNLQDAITQACRDNRMLSNLEICKKRNRISTGQKVG